MRWFRLVDIVPRENFRCSCYSHFCCQRTMSHLVLENKELPKNASSSSLSLKPLENDSFTNHEISGSTNPIFFERKIVNIANSIDDKIRKGERFYSLELFSSKKCNKEVYERFLSEVSMISLPPLFYATTWHEISPSHTISSHRSLEILNNFPENTLLHVAANNLRENEVRIILNDALAQGRTNIFALRGDHCTGSGDFRHAVDFVKFIRTNYENKFVICVAGFPQIHPESVSREMDIMYLKEKINAGANFVITQIFFESKVFVDFVKDCRKFGITVPIIPGIFPIPSFKSLTRMSKMCSFEIPRAILEDLEPIKDNDEDVYAYGIAAARKLIKEIFASQAASGFHLFTLNRSSVALDVCRKMFD